MNLNNPVREKLNAGEVVFGCFVAQPTPETVEILALAGFDFALLDAEHGPVSPNSIFPAILAAEARNFSAFARVGQNDRQVILKYLDLGVSGLMIPQVMNAEQAASAISATKYSPLGTRGLAGGRTFDFALTEPAPDRAAKLNDRILNMIQFEHIGALEHLDEILGLPELDVLFVGPNDLAQSLGLPGQPGHAEVIKIADQVVARAKAAGKKVGTTAGTPEAAQQVIARGFDMVVPNSPGLLASAAVNFVQGARK